MGISGHSWKTACSAILLLIALSPAASADEDEERSRFATWTPYWSKLIRSPVPKQQMTGLYFFDAQFPLQLAPVRSRGEFEVTAHITGGWARRRDCALLINHRAARFEEETGDRFTIDLPLDEDVTDLNFECVTPQGSMAQEVAQLKADHAEFFKLKKAQSKFKMVAVSVSIGPSQVAYSETGSPFPSFSETNLTLKASLKLNPATPWISFGLGGYSTIATLSSSKPGISASYLGLNFRAGLTFPNSSSPWKFSIYGGYYYANMTSSTGTFGFKNLIGPQIYPMLERSFEGGSNGYLYVKYSPVSDGFTFNLAPLDSREWASGIGYSTPLSTGSILYAVDFASITFSSGGKSVSSTSINGSIGYGF